MSETQEQIIARRDAEEMRQLRAEFEKLWIEKLAPRLVHPNFSALQKYRDLCWLAFKEGK